MRRRRSRPLRKIPKGIKRAIGIQGWEKRRVRKVRNRRFEFKVSVADMAHLLK
jgi:hypothetical protein